MRTEGGVKDRGTLGLASSGRKTWFCFGHLSDSFSEKHRSAAVDYWTSSHSDAKTMVASLPDGWRGCDAGFIGASSSKAFELH